jgi:hypothetical protein
MESETPAVFLLYIELHPLPWETEKSNTFNQMRNIEKGKNSSDWSESFRRTSGNYELASVITSCLLKAH